MTEIVIAGAVLIAVAAYVAGYLTGRAISRKRTKELKALYVEAISAARYVRSAVGAKHEQADYFNDRG